MRRPVAALLCLQLVLGAAIAWVAPDAPLGGTALLLLALGLLVRPLGLGATGARPRRLARRLLDAALLAIGALVHAQWLAHGTPTRLVETTAGVAIVGGALLVAAAWALGRGGVARLGRLVAVEWSRTWHARLFRLGLVAAVAITLLAGLTHEPLDDETGWSIVARTQGAGLWAAEVLLLVLGATSLAGEIAQGTLKMVLPHAYRRSEWIAAKAIVLLLAACCFALLVGAVSTVHAHVVHGLGDVVKEIPPVFGGAGGGIEVFQSADAMQGHLAQAWLAGLGALMASALVGLLFSSLTDSVVFALSMAFLLFLGLRSADVLLGVPPEVMAHVYATHPEQLREWLEKLGRAYNEEWHTAVLWRGLATAALTGAIAWLASLLVFERRDLS